MAAKRRATSKNLDPDHTQRFTLIGWETKTRLCLSHCRQDASYTGYGFNYLSTKKKELEDAQFSRLVDFCFAVIHSSTQRDKHLGFPQLNEQDQLTYSDLKLSS